MKTHKRLPFLFLLGYAIVIGLWSFPASSSEVISGYQAAALTTVSPSVGLTSVQIIGSNPGRKGLILYNNSSNSAYVNFGPTATSSGCSIIVPSFTSWNMPGLVSYTGPLSAIRNAGSGTIVVTEFYAIGAF